MGIIDFDFCVIAAGCNFGVFHKWGESLWFPTIHQQARLEGSWPHLDERFLEGRRRHILEEYGNIKVLSEKSASILVVGAGFIGVEWVTELQHFFPSLKMMRASLPVPTGSRILASCASGAALALCRRRSSRHPRSTNALSVLWAA